MNEIKLIRGDTETIRISFKNGAESSYEENSQFTFTARNAYTAEIMLSKVIEFPQLDFNLTHDETKKLSEGNHVYDIEFRKKDNSVVKTLVKGTLVVEGDVTYDTN